MARPQAEPNSAMLLINRIRDRGNIENFREMMSDQDRETLDGNEFNDETKSITLKIFLKTLADAIEILRDPQQNHIEQDQELIDVITNFGYQAKDAWYEFFNRAIRQGFAAAVGEEQDFSVIAVAEAAAFMAQNQSFDIDEVLDQIDEGQIGIDPAQAAQVPNAVVAFLRDVGRLADNDLPRGNNLN